MMYFRKYRNALKSLYQLFLYFYNVYSTGEIISRIKLFEKLFQVNFIPVSKNYPVHWLTLIQVSFCSAMLCFTTLHRLHFLHSEGLRQPCAEQRLLAPFSPLASAHSVSHLVILIVFQTLSLLLYLLQWSVTSDYSSLKAHIMVSIFFLAIGILILRYINSFIHNAISNLDYTVDYSVM